MRGPRITKLDIERFTEGDCHILAKVLHTLVEWPTYTLHTGDKQPGMHAFVYRRGTAIDVKGARPIDALMEDWEYAVGIVKTTDIDWGGEIFRGSWRRARTIAPLLIPAP